MTCDRFRLHKCLLLIAAFVTPNLLLTGNAQERKAEYDAFSKDARLDAGALKTLDQVRQLNENEATGGNVNYRDDVTVFTSPVAPATRLKRYALDRDPRKAAMVRIREIQKKLSSSESNGESEKVQAELKSALSDYFIADMQHRIRELDEIKAKVAETEASLQKRLDSQQQVVDLQLKLTLAEANGLGFFSKKDEGPRLNAPVPGVKELGPATGAAIGLSGPAHIPLGLPEDRF